MVCFTVINVCRTFAVSVTVPNFSMQSHKRMAVYLNIGLLQKRLGFLGVFRCLRFSVQIRVCNISLPKITISHSGCAGNTVPYL